MYAIYEMQNKDINDDLDNYAHKQSVNIWLRQI